MEKDFSVHVGKGEKLSRVEEPGRKGKKPGKNAKDRSVLRCLRIITDLFRFSFGERRLYAIFLLVSGVSICMLTCTTKVMSISCKADAVARLIQQDKALMRSMLRTAACITLFSVMREVYGLLFFLFINHTLKNISLALFNSTIHSVLPVASVRINRTVNRGIRGMRELLTKLLVVLTYRGMSMALIHVGLLQMSAMYIFVITIANIIYVAVSYFLLKIRIRNKVLKNTYDDLYSNAILECIGNRDAIIEGNTEEQESKRFGGYMAQYLKLSFTDRRIVSALNIVQKFIYTVLQMLLMLHLYLSGKADLGNAVKLLEYVKDLDRSLMEIALATKDIFVYYIDCEAYIEYIHELRENREPPVKAADTDPQELMLEKENEVQCGKIPALEFKNVNCWHGRSTKRLVSNFSCKVYRGEKVCIVGRSGCGKTTLISLLLKQKPYTGKIILEGVDIRELSKKEITQRISVVSQESSLFNNTLRYNIEYGSTPSPELVRSVLKSTKIDEIASSKEEGYEYNVGASGRNLSGGERQRVCLARSLLREKNTLILDEATSKLDCITEEKVIRPILQSEKTVIIITHSPQVAEYVDRIIRIG
ncbi:ATP-binding cassette, subfamily B (MDR/TAP), member 7 [Nematocida major]|uniref:ATP-binding cassette, subfamily B (MDR/TAP), member 7 n=1 Tax=Nematocida major TaxID=1912982 RepID=UPI0020085CA7|nr:ATP-binding cassette, subfamily B (MDR/TAP), member 7 [Nematocida major]KAH9385548.1 ATP-binding cassette, subfamily B (MDR/TAP), member 7 [Nematocida major]